MTTRETKAHLSDRIASAAARLFLDAGYHATGVAAIMEEADVRPGSFYNCFRSKEELLHAVLQWYEDHLHELVIGPIEQAEPDPLKRIFALMSWYAERLSETNCRIGCPIGNLALELSHTMPSIQPALDRNFRQWAAAIRSWLDDAKPLLAQDTNTDELSVFVLTVMEGGIMQARVSGSIAPFDASVRVLRKHIDLLKLRPDKAT